MVIYFSDGLFSSVYFYSHGVYSSRQEGTEKVQDSYLGLLVQDELTRDKTRIRATFNVLTNLFQK